MKRIKNIEDFKNTKYFLVKHESNCVSVEEFKYIDRGDIYCITLFTNDDEVKSWVDDKRGKNYPIGSYSFDGSKFYSITKKEMRDIIIMEKL